MEVILSLIIFGLIAFYGLKIARWFIYKFFSKTKECIYNIEDGYHDIKDSIQDKREQYIDIKLNRLKKEDKILQKKHEISRLKNKIKNSKSDKDLENEESRRRHNLKEKLLNSLKM